MSLLLKITGIILGIFHFTYLNAQTDSLVAKPDFAEIKTVFQHLQGYQKIILKTNLDSFLLNKLAGQEQAAVLMASGKDVKTIKWPIKIAARGKFRRIKCDLPPMWIDFPKDSLRHWGLFRAYDKLKLVTHCLTGQENSQALLKEYWTYKMHNQLTENSFKVHLVEVVYVHSEDPKRKIKSVAFLIESADEMAHRIGGRIVEGMGKTTQQLTPTSYHETLLFNYMIGNTDWQIKLHKNIKLVQKEKEEQLTVVPFDFDFTAFSNPSYLKIIAQQGTTPSADNRIAMGKSTDFNNLKEVAARFLALRKTGFQCFNDCTRLTGHSKRQMQAYLYPFYRILKKEQWLAGVFVE